MVNLGFARRSDLDEMGIPRVSFVRADQEKEPVLRSWPLRDIQLWELQMALAPENKWPEKLADCLQKLHWQNWGLDVHSILTAYGSGSQEELQKWGDKFWPVYRSDAVVYLLGKGQDPLCRKLALDWDHSNTHVCMREKYDLTRRTEEEGADRPAAGKIRGLKHKFMRR